MVLVVVVSRRQTRSTPGGASAASEVYTGQRVTSASGLTACAVAPNRIYATALLGNSSFAATVSRPPISCWVVMVSV